MTTDETTVQETVDENEQIVLRKQKLGELREHGNAYPNTFRRDAIADDLHKAHGEKEKEALEKENISMKVAGRIMTRRLMGKASFVTIQDMGGRIQLYLRRDDLPEGRYAEFKRWDLGDIVGAEGVLFKTQTGELSVKCTNVELLTKALRPMPDKFHGLADQELRYRQRYVDMMVNEKTRSTFVMRSELVAGIRKYLIGKQFLEVETPMMQSIAGGAAARPFITHHNALDMKLYLRIAPELFLKRLVVGGFEKVFEINRNFRNEGLSTRHNPEFTMLEFYLAYADYNDLIDLIEGMMRYLAKEVLHTSKVEYQGVTVNFDQPFTRLTLFDSILKYNPDITADQLNDFDKAKVLAKKLEIPVQEIHGLGKIQLEIFEKTTERELKEPTFITQYPTEVSPLARRNDDDPFVTDRFEFFVAGQEIANGFSELNDPEEQAARFEQQLKERDAGDLEAMPYDEDYICALEYGMPPTGGVGVGIDRLVMLFTDSASIRDVILFPLLRPTV